MKRSKTDPTKTVLIVTAGFLTVFIFAQWDWALYVSFITGLTGVFSNYLSKQIDILWYKLSWLLSLVIPNVLLSLIFFLFLFPIALLSKTFGEKDPLRLKNTKSSMYKTVSKHFSKSSFEMPW